MSEIALVYVLFGDRAAAQAAAHAMVEQRLAACANVLAAGQSIYSWEGRIAEAEEVPVLFKTMPACREALMDALARTHAYELPAILSWPVTASADYAAWVDAETQA